MSKSVTKKWVLTILFGVMIAGSAKRAWPQICTKSTITRKNRFVSGMKTITEKSVSCRKWTKICIDHESTFTGWRSRMEEKQLKFFKDLLTRWLDELLGQADNTMMGLRSTDDHLADPLDRAVFDTDRSLMLRIRDRERVLINKIKKSLEDIENGEYGICEECGQEISIERLKARPVARRCFQCKTKQEKIEKMMGV